MKYGRVELYENLRGFQHQCRAIDGEPSVIAVRQSFPEHPDVPPLAQRFEVFAGSYLEEAGSREAP